MQEPFNLREPEPILVLDQLEETLAHFLKLLSSLRRNEWERPTPCEGWSVKDVALHLLGVEIGNLSVRRDQFHLAGGTSSWEEQVSTVNQWNQVWVEAARRISAPHLIELLEFSGQKAYTFFRSLDLFRLGAPVSWAGPEPQPVWFDVAREYTERWHHQQHIRDAVGKPGLKEPRYLKPVLETFVRAMPHAFRMTTASEGTTITLTIQGDSGGQWTLLQEQDGWGFFQGVASDPDAEIVLDQDVAWRLFTKGIGEEDAGKFVTIKGKRRLARPVFGMTSILA
jgi:uncharacterized protein (TIGR03083 family)